jgi:hypothetical protein
VPAHQPGELVNGKSRTGDRGERGSRIRQHRGTRLREAHGPAGAVQQVLSEFALESPDLGAHPRLRDVHPGGRPREVRLLGDGHEVLQLTQLHNQRF